MIDIIELQTKNQQLEARNEYLEEKLLDHKTRLKAMEIAYFEKVVEVDRLKEKLESLGVKV